METFQHPPFAGEAAGTPSEPRHAGQPSLPYVRAEPPRRVEEPFAEWEDLWIDLGGGG
jgi:hypothetical protein